MTQPRARRVEVPRALQYDDTAAQADPSAAATPADAADSAAAADAAAVAGPAAAVAPPAGSDYASAFALPTPEARSLSPEQWARAVFEDAPGPLRRLLPQAWRFGLGLRLGPRTSPGHVLGWPVIASGPDSATLQASSRLMTARNTVLVDDARVVWVTTVRFDRPAARPLWAAAAPVHHLVVPYLLGRAGRAGRAPVRANTSTPSGSSETSR